MSQPKYRPRDFCEEPGFGKVRNVRWVTADSEGARALILAAQLQHGYALRIRARAKLKAIEWAAQTTEELKNEEQPLYILATKIGCSYARLLRCLRGEVVMHLHDIAWADIVVGEITRPASPPITSQPRSRTPQHTLRR